MVLPENSLQTPKLYYNVDRRNKLTNKPLAIMDICSE